MQRGHTIHECGWGKALRRHTRGNRRYLEVGRVLPPLCIFLLCLYTLLLRGAPLGSYPVFFMCTFFCLGCKSLSVTTHPYICISPLDDYAKEVYLAVCRWVKRFVCGRDHVRAETIRNLPFARVLWFCIRYTFSVKLGFYSNDSTPSQTAHSISILF